MSEPTVPTPGQHPEPVPDPDYRAPDRIELSQTEPDLIDPNVPEPGVLEPDLAELEPTGQASVDAALRAVADAAGAPPTDQLPAYQAAHRVLRETLASIDEG